MAKDKASPLEQLCDPAHPLQREFAALILVLTSNDPNCGKTATHAQSPHDLYSWLVAQRAMLNYAMAARDLLTPSEQSRLERLKHIWTWGVEGWARCVRIKWSSKHTAAHVSCCGAFAFDTYHITSCKALFDKACLRMDSRTAPHEPKAVDDIDAVAEVNVDKAKVMDAVLSLYEMDIKELFLFVKHSTNRSGVLNTFLGAARRMLARDNPGLQGIARDNVVQAYSAHMVVEFFRLCAYPPQQTA